MATDTMQVKRLLRVLEQLRLGKPFTIGELAESCGASRRGVARDIWLLCELGYPLQEDTDRHIGKWYFRS